MDCAPLLRAIIQLDIVLKRGVLVSLTDESTRDIDDGDVAAALTNVTRLIGILVDEMDKASRFIARHAGGSAVLQ